MKLHTLVLACAASLLASPTWAEDRLSFDSFHDSLSPYGEWNQTDTYGLVWQPTGVDRDWSPYTDGYWSYTDAGWTWVSYEDWGGICYHYGRWVELEGPGWCWVPGYEWGPAWVSWRKSDDYVGWAPLPPEARWEVNVGISSWADTHYDIGPAHYSFCHSRDFGAPVLRGVIVPRSRNVTIINFTTNITNITYNRDSGYVFNGGLDYDYISPRCAHTLPALKLVQNTTNIYVNGNRGNVFINAQRGNALYVAAPQRAESNWNVLTRKPVIAKTFAAPVVSRGWAGMDKDGTRDKLLVKMRGEVNDATPASAPARAFRPESIAVVPKKADPTLPRPSLLKANVSRPADDSQDGPSTLKAPVARPMVPDAREEKPTVLKQPIVHPGRPDDDSDKPVAIKPQRPAAPTDEKPTLLKQPIVRPSRPDDDSDKPVAIKPQRPAAPTDEKPTLLKQPIVRPSRPDDDSGKPAAIKPQRPPVIERPAAPKDDSVLRKKMAEQADDNNAREAAIARERASQAARQREADDARRMTVEKQRRSADAEDAQRKQAEAARNADENARRQAQQRSAAAAESNARREQAAAMERQRNAAEQDNARRAQAADSQRRAQAEMANRAANEARQRQSEAARQAPPQRPPQAIPQRPPAPTQPAPSQNRPLTEEEQKLLKKKR